MPDIVVVGGGASAVQSYDWMQGCGFPIIAASTMLIPLHRARIKVDVACVIDAAAVMPLHFVDVPKDGELCHMLPDDRDIVQEWQGVRTKRFVADSFGGSVIHLCVSEAVRRGATTVHLVGVDFCYLDGLSHAPGVPTAYAVDMHPHREEINAQGERVQTERSLLSYRGQLALYICEHRNIRFVNHSRRGLAIPGTTYFDDHRGRSAAKTVGA